MTQTNKKAYWSNEMPPEIKELISNIMIEKHIENFNEHRDPYCLVQICDALLPYTSSERSKGLKTIKEYLLTRSHKKGLRYKVDEEKIIRVMTCLKGKMSMIQIRKIIAEKFGYTEEAIRKIIDKHK